MNLGNRQGRKELSMDMTPLLDVVFLLLIFFVLTTTFVSNPGIEVDLPKAASGESLTPEEAIVVVIDSNGAFVHEGEILSLERLDTKFSLYETERAGSPVIIQADESAQHGQVIKVLDLARKHGFHKLALATEEE